MIRNAKLALTAPLAGLAVLAGVLFGTLAEQAQPAAFVTISADGGTTPPPPPPPADTHW